MQKNKRWKKWCSQLKYMMSMPYPCFKPEDGYPSRIVDSQGCEFGFEMYYHVPYAYHLYKQGLLRKTVSCRDTRCFYWFSPHHEELYTSRQYVWEFPCVGQIAFDPPALDRWESPEFQTHYANRVAFNFERPLLLIFNKYNSEWARRPVNYLCRNMLAQMASDLRDHYQLVYLRPTDEIVGDEALPLDLREKKLLQQQGVLLAETLHAQHPELTYNELQLCLLAQSKLRIATQGGAAYLNAFFPGETFVLHRYGFETDAHTYEYLSKLAGNSYRLFESETELWETLLSREAKSVAHDESSAA